MTFTELMELDKQAKIPEKGAIYTSNAKRTAKRKRRKESLIYSTKSKSEKPTVRKSVRKSERSELRSENRTVQLPATRRTKRYSFEFYADQLITLKRMRAEAELAGKSINLSSVVRIALDEHLKNLGAKIVDSKE